jgi:UDP-N-acetylglucosamine 2-epimerase (non-hydrolysing)
VLSGLDLVLDSVKPDIVLVQGDTTTAMTSALAAFHRKIPVAHIEAGLRSGDDFSPYPEEMNRKLITRLATYHFAATCHNRNTLLAEGVAPEAIFVTGNPVVDALDSVVKCTSCSSCLRGLLNATSGYRRVVLTTHRRESLGPIISQNLRVLSSFVKLHSDVVLIFPAHPNPKVVSAAYEIFDSQPRVHVVSPLGYADFIFLLSRSWLIVSDSGGVQEEAPSLGKPLLIIRENTERPEALEAGVARLVGGRPEALRAMLEEAYRQGSWAERVGKTQNPFGRGDASKQIVSILAKLLGEELGSPAKTAIAS